MLLTTRSLLFPNVNVTLRVICTPLLTKNVSWNRSLFFNKQDFHMQRNDASLLKIATTPNYLNIINMQNSIFYSSIRYYSTEVAGMSMQEPQEEIPTDTWHLRDGFNYDGDMLNGKPEGNGVLSYPDGKKYQGNFANGMKHGKGIMIWSNKRYEGDYVNNKRCGTGVMTWANGFSYTGDFKDNEMSGQGTMVWANGKRYTGKMAKNKPNGKGVLEWPTGQRYEGEFLDGELHGKGILYLVNGVKFDGNFKNNQKHGEAVTTWTNGMSAKSNWIDGAMEKFPMKSYERLS